MSSLVEAIAKQAQTTFLRSFSDETFAESLSKLISSVNRLRASDLNVNKEAIPSETAKSSAPVNYIEVSENPTFSMGIFLLRSGARIPLHDHPGMFGVLKVIHGTLKITSYSRLSKVHGDFKLPQDLNNRVRGVQRDLLVPVQKHMSGNVTEKDEPCVVQPTEGNFHEISAVGGPAAFLDILAPPYDMIERNCHYYIPLESKKPDAEAKTWLLRTPSPTDFWVDPAPYRGPSVSV